jgi:NAD(P)H-hydrate epimerase
MKIVNISQMQKAERDCSKFGISLEVLMENAGKAFAEEIRRFSDDIQKQNIVFIIGPGNNGGDGLVAARYLKDWGALVKVCLCGKRPDNDQNLELVKQRRLHLINASGEDDKLLQEWLSETNIIVDAIFGTGKSRAISGEFAKILNTIKEAKNKFTKIKIIALDLPSGLNADTGDVDPATPNVDYTITLGFPKIGLFNLPGAEKAGKISIVNIGIPSHLVDYINTDLISDDWVKSHLPRRTLTSHKGSYGKILALVGSINYLGAAYLACGGTLRVGAGLTTLAIARSLLTPIASKIAEVTYLPMPETNQEIDPGDSLNLIKQNIKLYDVLLVGCGIGQSSPVINLVNELLFNSSIRLPALVLDADAINILGKTQDWYTMLKDDAILTPHAGEMARLLGKSIEEIQRNRIKIAREIALKWHKTLVLKGAYTVIASAEGKICVSPFANAGLASAGTGDVLAGSIAGMLAQGMSLFDAAACGVYLHGLAGEIIRSELGDAGMIASDLLPALPRAIRQIKDV